MRAAIPFHFYQMRQQLRMRLYVKDIARYVALGGLCHERFAPEAQQRLRRPVGRRIRKDKGDVLVESAPMRFLYLAMAVASSDFR